MSRGGNPNPNVATRFKAGHSGHPGGRPKQTPELLALARAETVEAFNTIVAIMKDKGAPKQARLLAANLVLERGHGKAVSMVDMRIEDRRDDVRQYTDDELQALIDAGTKEARETQALLTAEPPTETKQ
jgi:hypothetical protein